MSNHYDVCLISYSNVFTDARTLNLANTLSISMSVLVIALSSNLESTNLHNFELIEIELNKDFSGWKNWINFSHKAKSINITSNYFVACDLYSLVPASYQAVGSNSQLIYDSREIYSKLGPLSNKPLKQFIISQIEKFYIQNVSKVIVSGELDAEYLRKYFKQSIEYIVIKNLPPFSIHKITNRLRNEFKIPSDKLILIYQGAILDGRGIIPTLKAIKDNNNYHFVIIGDGNFKQKLIEFVNSNNLFEKVTFVGEVPYSELISFTSSADIGICLFEPISKSYELSLPNKLFEYMMAGIPCIATNLPAINELLSKNKIGVLINDVNDVEEIIDNLEKLENTVFRNELSENAKKLRVNYSYESQENLILSIFN
ncbi:MAG: glycosyltransferase [Candidatus Kapabacteria bacterium]|nr:glycosyltransferase [Candidatus Kapabacteria bacterium]